MKRFATIVTTALALACLARAAVAANEEAWPMPEWKKATPAAVGLDAAKLDKARRYALTAGGSGCIVRGGKLVLTWGSQTRKYDLKSTTKSIGFTAVGLALTDGKIKSLTEKVGKYQPEFLARIVKGGKPDWPAKVTLLHLATQTSGLAKPGGYGKILFAPGTKWHYSDAGPNWLAECVTLAYKQDLSKLMFERVFTPIGLTAKDIHWRPNMYRPKLIAGVARREFGAGLHANVNALARIGLLYLRAGRWGRRQLLPADFVASVAKTPKSVKGIPVVDKIGVKPPATNHYGLLWWTNADGAISGVPRDAYFSWGLYDSHIVVVPSLDLVVARAGKSWPRRGRTDYETLGGFLRPICAAAGVEAPAKPVARIGGAPYPPSEVITRIAWAAKSSIVRKATGSDNWPCTWADDGALYTAYGDGWGFVPKVKGKLSLGLGKVSGDPPAIKGVNIRSKTGEAVGDGARARKASGMLMTGGVLYMWVRNDSRTGTHSRLASSADHGKTWTWAKWKFAALGYCTFVNYGRNYAGARDEYVYIVSHDNPSAYKPADRFILMRVPAKKLMDRSAYEFFTGRDASGGATWSKDLARRAAVFENRRSCMRSGISYNAALKRYLWCQVLPVGAPRFKGGFGIYEAPEPWGPWRTVYFTKTWDVGPGETCSFPTKWIDADGLTVHLVFSGEDAFSVRRAKLTVAGMGP